MNILLCVTLLTLTVQKIATATESYDDSDEELDKCPNDLLLCSPQNRSSQPAGCASGDYHGEPRELIFCNSMHCEPEVFQHDYIVRNHDQTPHTNKWKRARIGEAATLHDVCLLRNGLPVTRKCRLKDMRAQWEPIGQWDRVVCMRRFRQHSISVELNSLHDDMLEGRRFSNDTQGRRTATTLMRNMFRQKDRTLLPADVHVTGQVFTELIEHPKDAGQSVNLVSICGEIMSSSSQVLRISAQINATNSLLNKFEDYMDSLTNEFLHQDCHNTIVYSASDASEATQVGVEIINNVNMGVYGVVSRNLSVFYIRPSCDNITGIAIYSADGAKRKPSSSGFWYRFLTAAESVDKLKQEAGLEAATFIPENLWQQLKAASVSYMVIKVYAHDGLFVETSLERKRRPRSRVLSITLPEYEYYLPLPLPFLLRNENQRQPDERALQAGSGCGYWNYRTWLSDGLTTASTTDVLRDPIIVCQTRHLTQFSYLVGGSYRINDLGEDVLVSPLNERVLDIISIVGCSLSLFGVLGIFVTAAVFKSWRSQASTKVLLHLCLAMTLQMVLFVFINTDDISELLVSHGSYIRCVILGALLQYSILVLFTWMLIIAFLQFQRYVTVIGIERPKHYILKAALVAWLLPLLPTVLVACIDPHSYVPSQAQLDTDTGICYPSGYGLTFGVVLPVTLITVANLVVFVYVFYSISSTLNQTIHRTERKMVHKQIRLSVMLFFLLGLSWIFGIFAFMQAGIAFSYLFCLTATLQGFVLFIYFVVLDVGNRQAWLAIIWPTRMKMDVQKRTRELQSMTTTSTNISARA